MAPQIVSGNRKEKVKNVKPKEKLEQAFDSDSSEYSELDSEDENSTEDEEVEENEASEESTKDEEEGNDDDKIEFKEHKEGDLLIKVPKHAKKKVLNKKRNRDEAKEVETAPESSSACPVAQVEEYEFDSSDEEDIRNTIGNVPVEWYENYAHIGYDLDGKKIYKPIKGDELDEFLSKMDNPDYWRTVKDKMTGQDVVLTDEDIDLIQRLQKGAYPVPEMDPYEPFEDFFSYEMMIHPVTNRPEHKRSFIPSKVEKEKVSRMVHAIKMGWIKSRPPKEDPNKFYMLWDNEDDAKINKRMQHYIPAPKMKLPGHAESYNPPPEYLLTKEEEEKWKEQEPEERNLNFIPKKYSCLRHVPSYPDFIKERFERCLDLYLCPRQRKMRLNVNPDDLIPKLPKPKDLQPFPSIQSLVYHGHTDTVTCLSVEPLGQFFASGSDDCTVRIWEVLTGRCMKVIRFDNPVKSIAWCPSQSVCLLAVAVDKNMYIINPGVGDKLIIGNTDTVMKALPELEPSENKSSFNWEMVTLETESWEQGLRLIIHHRTKIEQVTWHPKGDYFAVVQDDVSCESVVIHQLSARRSLTPFSKFKGKIVRVLFHTVRPYFFVATERHVKVYNLLKQEMTKKLLSNCKYISSMALHPKGDNLIIGSFENRLSWFDLDLSTKPYKTLKYHKRAIRQVTFHKKYPLFASSSDDGTVIICHGMVYNDLMQNPLIVPVKVLRGHAVQKNGGVLDCCFLPSQPWILTAGADTTIRLFT